MSKHPWLDIMMEERGEREIPGHRENARIREYFESTDYPIEGATDADSVAWCSACACFCMEKAGIRSPRSASSQAWLDWGVPCSIQKGAVVVFSNGDGTGHVGFVYDFNSDGIFVVGGNQSDSVCISFFSYRRVAGYRLPGVL